VLRIGDQDTVEVPMTTSVLRSLHDAPTAVLATTTPAEPRDFVAEWRRCRTRLRYLRSS
jgi:hypothetical protein